MATKKQAKIESSFPAITERDIDQYEQRAGITLPEDYKAFLLSSNGGIPTPQQADIPKTEHSVLVDYLYGILENRESGDLEHETLQRGDDLPDGFIAIGHDPGGNSFLLGTKGQYRGKVYFWDSVGLLASKSPSGNTFWLADSITDLLHSLYQAQ